MVLPLIVSCVHSTGVQVSEERTARADSRPPGRRRFGAFRERRATGSVLIVLRLLCTDHLQALPRPVGFRRVSDGAGSQTGPPTQDGPVLPAPACP